MHDNEREIYSQSATLKGKLAHNLRQCHCEGVPFGVINFTSHDICVQVFQMKISALPLILPTYKYFRHIFKGRNEQLEVQIFDSGIIANTLQKVLVILEVQFHHDGAVGDHYLRNPKSCLCWGSILPFWEVFRNIYQFCLLNILLILFYAKSGSFQCQMC